MGRGDDLDPRVAYIYQQGFPLDTPESEAIAEATAAALGLFDGVVLSLEVLRNDELTADNTFLVTVRLEAKPVEQG